MPAILFDLAVVLSIVYCGWLGYDKGLVVCSAVAAQLIASSYFAMLLFEFTAGTSLSWFEESARLFIPDGFDSQGWFVFLFLAGLMWGTVAALYLYVLPQLLACDFQTFPLIDRIGGGLAGGYAGSILVGMVLITLSSCPVAAAFPIPVQNMAFDCGSWLIRSFEGLAGDPSNGRSLVIYGEPTNNLAGVNTLLGSENWVDRDEDGEFDPVVDVYYDADGDESYSDELRFDDLDGDQSRRIGLLEKYQLGRWNQDLLVAGQAIKQKPAALTKAEKPKPITAKPDQATDEDPFMKLLTNPRQSKPTVNPEKQAQPQATARESKATTEPQPPDDQNLPF